VGKKEKVFFKNLKKTTAGGSRAEVGREKKEKGEPGKPRNKLGKKGGISKARKGGKIITCWSGGKRRPEGEKKEERITMKGKERGVRAGRGKRVLQDE